MSRGRPGSGNGRWGIALTAVLAGFALLALRAEVVVESVAPLSAPEKAGLTAGDRLARAVVLEQDGRPGEWVSLSSPYAWERFEALRAGWGSAVLEGQRNGTPARWDLGPGRGGLKVRPAREGDPLGACWEKVQAAWTAAAEKRWQEALSALGDAEALAGDLAPEVLPGILLERGNLLRKKGDLAGAGEAFARAAAACAQKFGESDLWRAECLYRQGAAAWVRRDLSAAEGPHREALALRRKLAPGSPDEAESLNSLGGIAFARADFDGAAALYAEALALFEKADPGGVGSSKVLSNLGSVHRNLGDLPEAEGYVGRALDIQRRLDPGSLVLANSLNNLGLIAHERGDLAKAESCHREALALRERHDPEGPAVAASLNNLAGVAESRGDAVQAGAWYARAVGLMEKKAPDSLDLASCLSNLGAVLGAQGKGVEAREVHLRALAIEESLAPEGAGAAGSHFNLGTEALRAGDPAEARSRFERSAALFRKAAPGSLGLAGALVQQGLLDVRAGDAAGSRAFLEEALSIRARLAPGSMAEAEVLRALGAVAALEGKKEEAIAWSLRALDALDAQMGRLGGSHEVRAEYRSGALPFYEEAMDRLLSAARGREAFSVFERGKARVLLEILGERDLLQTLQVPPDLAREGRRLDRACGRVMEALAETGGESDPEPWKRLTLRLSELRAERAALAFKVRQASPAYAALAYPQPLGIDGVCGRLPEGVCLVAYSVGESSTRLFAVASGGGFRAVALPVGRDALGDKVKAFRKAILEARSPARGTQRVTARGQDLYDLLLGPAEALVGPSRHLVIVPDGPLHALPFGVLSPGREGAFLGAMKTLSISPSATAYVELGEGLGKNPVGGVAAAFAWGGEGGASRPNLSATLPEAHELAGLGRECRFFTGEEATEARFRESATSASVLHFACHANLDGRFPLNSCLLLKERAGGRPEEDGRVRAWEVLQEIRTPARLVVLSACETGLGREVAGEGLLGLVRAFHAAGAPAVAASLWKVEDSTTARMMGAFYVHLGKGASPAEALRKAQSDLREGRATGLPLPPYYWAAFQIYGRGDK
ncbi:MAG: CHAT domain-containing protein [Acidobacteriota bacterium]